MSDDDLAAIRAKRLAEMQAQHVCLSHHLLLNKQPSVETMTHPLCVTASKHAAAADADGGTASARGTARQHARTAPHRRSPRASFVFHFSILASIFCVLHTFSRAGSKTVSRVALVKPEKARAVGDMIIQNAMSGRLAQRVDEAELIRILEQVSAQFDRPVTVKFVRRRDLDSDDDEDNDGGRTRPRDARDADDDFDDLDEDEDF